MKINGTKFQKKVWEEIKRIPKGSVKTYKEIACILGKPNSSFEKIFSDIIKTN